MNIRRRLFEAAASLTRWLRPKPDQSRTVAALEGAVSTLSKALNETRSADAQRRESFLEMVSEMAEAAQMAGSGPWQVSASVVKRTNELVKAAAEAFDRGAGIPLREGSTPLPVSQGAYGDIELALQNVEWRREINLSWYEFSRWGIQQIMLISRLYYVKNPIIRRLIDVAAVYVFGRGVDVGSSDPDAADVLKEFFERNKNVVGQRALCALERQKYYDGNLFFIFFADKQDKGLTTIRTLDGTEIQEIVSNPEDVDEPWYYHRQWVQRNFDAATGQVSTQQMEIWYPALGFDPKQKPEKINNHPVSWETPVYHRKYGQVGKWKFGCPIIYPALAWAKAAGKFLEACATVKQSLANISLLLTTKGGQQALEGAKQQLQTTVGPSSAIWDTNPPPVKGAVFASGPGTQLEPFNTRMAGADPEEVRQYKLMSCMVAGVPETFLADVSTGNLATATTLDRPTELVFQEKQEDWREILVTIGKYVLEVSKGAPSGRLSEALRKRGAEAVVICEGAREPDVQGRMRYTPEARRKKPNQIDVLADFPAIREGDLPQIVNAIVAAATLNNKDGQVVGIDEKIAVGLLYKTLGVDNWEETLEAQYSDKEYDPDRTQEPEPPPQPTAAPPFGGVPPAPPQPGAAPGNPPPAAAPAKESLLDIAARLREVGERILAGSNGRH